MGAETLTAAQAEGGHPIPGPGDAGNVKVAWGTYAIAANVVDGDIFEMHYIPAGCTVFGGWVIGEDLDTGIEAIDMDIGWAANDVDAADPDGFGNLGVWTGDTSPHIAGTINYFPYQNVLTTAGPKTFTRSGGKTMVQIEANAAAATFSAGQVTAVTLLTV